ncbi:hypothetical protein Vafri_13476, partial [Volvox africanus]
GGGGMDGMDDAICHRSDDWNWICSTDLVRYGWESVSSARPFHRPVRVALLPAHPSAQPPNRPTEPTFTRSSGEWAPLMDAAFQSRVDRAHLYGGCTAVQQNSKIAAARGTEPVPQLTSPLVHLEDLAVQVGLPARVRLAPLDVNTPG